MPPETIIIDCDPGLDDAVAIALAASAPQLAIDAITTVAGNAPIDRVSRNACGIVRTLGLAATVHGGCARPLQLDLRTSTMLWGGDGDLGLPAGAPADHQHGVNRLIDHLEGWPARSRRIVAIGPLTNIAVMLVMRPELADAVAELVVMGGGLEGGNATPHAELNIWVDPHAAALVFASGMPVTVAPLEVTEPLKVPQDVMRALAGAPTPAAQLVAGLLRLSGIDSHASSIYDAAAIAWLLWPELFSAERGTLSVETRDVPAIGRTHFTAGSGAHRVLTGLDAPAFFARFLAQLSGGA